MVTPRRSILGPPAEGRPGPSDDDDDDDDKGHEDNDDIALLMMRIQPEPSHQAEAAQSAPRLQCHSK